MPKTCIPGLHGDWILALMASPQKRWKKVLTDFSRTSSPWRGDYMPENAPTMVNRRRCKLFGFGNVFVRNAARSIFSFLILCSPYQVVLRKKSSAFMGVRNVDQFRN
jgi:hypothetical protein